MRCVGASSGLAALLLVSACFIVRTAEIQPVERDPVFVITPVRAHLTDGSTVLFRSGAQVTRDGVVGDGMRYGLRLSDSARVSRVVLADVVGMETYRGGVDPFATVVLSAVGTVAITAAAAVAAVAIFGSCPTVYGDSAGTEVLQGESFSYSIAPLFEARDVDRLGVGADREGRVRLEVRNEALETHYINQLEVLEADHATDEIVVPDAAGRPVAVWGAAAPVRATDRSGRNVRAELAVNDGVAFASAPATLRGATAGDHDDWIDLEMPAPDVDSVVLVMRLRNSLLTTVLFYDVMLGDRGAHAMDYVAEDLGRIGPAVNLGQWYVATMGMRVMVRDRGDWRPAGRLGDTGPIAWKDVAVVVPVPHDGPVLRVRLEFVTDDWRIDRLTVASAYRRPAVRHVPLDEVVGADGRPDTAALSALRSADGRYLETSPGQRFVARFDAGPGVTGSARTFLLASQGYYTEWVRPRWLMRPHPTPAFEPGDAAIGEALGRWRADHDAVERQFAATRLPVR